MKKEILSALSELYIKQEWKEMYNIFINYRVELELKNIALVVYLKTLKKLIDGDENLTDINRHMASLLEGEDIYINLLP